MYKLKGESVLRLADGASIPMVNGNRDYEEYKLWLAEGNIPEPEFTLEQIQEKLYAEAKQAKQVLLDSITVTTTSGKVFDGREKDVSLMSGAIQAADVIGVYEHEWKLHDNTVQVVTIAELKEALALAMQAIGAIKTS